MSRGLFSQALLLLLVASAAAAAPPATQWDDDIRAFEEADRVEPPPPGGVLFVGSSSIRMWTTLAEDFPGVRTINRGFGGSEIADTTRYAERIVLPYRPRAVVMYAGDNDLMNGKSPQRVRDDFAAFVTRVRRDLPNVCIGFISVKPSPSRRHLLESMRQANGLVRDYAATETGVAYLDVFQPMLDGDGRSRPELFVEDMLHLDRAAYELWTSVLSPWMRELPQAAPSSPSECPEGADVLSEAALTAIEERIGGRVGVALVGGDGTVRRDHRGGERFAMCSTFKLALSAAVLEEVAAGRMSLDDDVPFGEADLLDYAPVAREHVAEGRMTVGELAEAISTLSDNTAANLLLARIGGPTALTEFFRRHGDELTRLDRTEPELNENAPGDERDTTTPRAMAGLVQRLVLGGALGAEAREQLAAWAVANRTGDNRIRAGIPDGWRVGDKTGTCGTAYNDVAIVWPPAAEPFVLAVYVDRPTAEAEQVEAAIAEIGSLAAKLATARTGVGRRAGRYHPACRHGLADGFEPAR